MTALLEDHDQFVAIGRYDWYVTAAGRRLHWADVTGHEEEITVGWAVTSAVRLACGRTVTYLCIPGLFTRMGAQRCIHCCRALGYPRGKGSPKNDNACRVILGLPVTKKKVP